MRKRRLTLVLAALAVAGIPLAAIAMKLPSRPQMKTAPMKLTAPSWQSGQYWADFDHHLLVDFADLAHFRAADESLGPPAAGARRVVFLGDSITEGWKLRPTESERPLSPSPPSRESSSSPR